VAVSVIHIHTFFDFFKMLHHMRVCQLESELSQEHQRKERLEWYLRELLLELQDLRQDDMTTRTLSLSDPCFFPSSTTTNPTSLANVPQQAQQLQQHQQMPSFGSVVALLSSTTHGGSDNGQLGLYIASHNANRSSLAQTKRQRSDNIKVAMNQTISKPSSRATFLRSSVFKKQEISEQYPNPQTQQQHHISNSSQPQPQNRTSLELVDEQCAMLINACKSEITNNREYNSLPWSTQEKVVAASSEDRPAIDSLPSSPASFDFDETDLFASSRPLYPYPELTF
jgi:hypothetical protein